MKLNEIHEILSAREALRKYLKDEKRSFRSVCLENGLNYHTERASFFSSQKLVNDKKHPRRIDIDRLTKFVKLVNEKAYVSVVNSEVIIKNKNIELRVEKEAKAKLEKELQDKKDAEVKAERERLDKIEAEKKEAEKLAKAPIKKQMENWVNSFNLPNLNLENAKKTEIIETFEKFKKWAKKEIENL